MMGVERTERRSSTKAAKSNTDSGVAGFTIALQEHAARLSDFRFRRFSRRDEVDCFFGVVLIDGAQDLGRVEWRQSADCQVEGVEPMRQIVALWKCSKTAVWGC